MTLKTEAGSSSASGRFSIVPASYLALFQDGKILLLRRYNTGYEDGKYSLPAGHVESGETFTECVARESKEEIGIDLRAEDARMALAMYRNSGTPQNGSRMDVFFVSEKWSGNVENREPNKCDELIWVDPSNLPENTIPYIRQAIANIQAGESFVEYGWER